MQQSRKKILIADDSEDIRGSLSRLLNAYDITTAPDGESALKLALEEKPCLILLDIDMPGLNGLQVLERLGEVTPRPTAVMLTGDTELETGIRAISLGAYAYLTKPFEKDRVLETVQAALAEHARRNSSR